MKAQFVYEKLDFERGKDPKEAMNIGQKELRYLKIPELKFSDYPWIDDLIQNRTHENIFYYGGIYNIIYNRPNGTWSSISNIFHNPRNRNYPASEINQSKGYKSKDTLIRNIISYTDKWLKERGMEEAIPFKKEEKIKGLY